MISFMGWVFGKANGKRRERQWGQRQLDRPGALVCKRQGRTLVDSWNPKSRLASRLRDLTGVVYDGLDPQIKELLFAERHHPRAKDKPVIRGLTEEMLRCST